MKPSKAGWYPPLWQVTEARQAMLRAWWLVGVALALHGLNLWVGFSYRALEALPKGPRAPLLPITFLGSVASAGWSVAAGIFRFVARLYYYSAAPLADMHVAALLNTGPSGGDVAEMLASALRGSAYAVGLEVALSALVLVCLARALSPSPYGRPNALVHWWRVFRVGLISSLPLPLCAFLPVPILFLAVRGTFGPFARLLLALVVGLGVFFACLSLALQVCAAAKAIGLLGAVRALRSSATLPRWLLLLALAGAAGWVARWAEGALVPWPQSLVALRVTGIVLVSLCSALGALGCLALMLRMCKGEED